MKWHCGVLDEEPWTNPTMRWISRGGWTNPTFPEEVRLELAIWLATPGFSDPYHIHNLRTSQKTLVNYRPKLPGYADLRKEVGENWLSVTHEDAVKLCRLRKGKGDIPAVSQFHMLTDLKSSSYREVAREYGITHEWLFVIKKHGIRFGRRQIPEGFDLLAAS